MRPADARRLLSGAPPRGRARIAERGLSSYPDFPMFNAGAAAAAAQLGRKEEAHRYIEALRPGTTGGRCTAGCQSGLCPLWVRSRRSVITEPCPLYPRKRTSSGYLGMSALCQKRTFALQQIARLFDHLVSAGKQRRRNGDAEQLRRLNIDNQLELSRLHDRKVRGLGALENPTGIDAELAMHVGNAGAVAHQPAGLDHFTRRIARGQHMACGKRGQLNAPAVKEAVRADKQRVRSPTHKDCQGRIDLLTGAGVVDLDL